MGTWGKHEGRPETGRFAVEIIFGCQVTGTGDGSSGDGRSAIGSWHPASGG